MNRMILKQVFRGLLFLVIPFTMGCERLESVSQKSAPPAEEFGWADSEGIKNALQRMSAMARVKWDALYNVPLNKDFFLFADEGIKGIPYSSTKEINKYVGIDVSFYTFLTAAANPYSVLYTENIGKAPYHGTNCACYYGTVCSAAVSYALGLKAAQPSFMFPYLDGIERIANQDVSSLKVCDILQAYTNDTPGHIFMIYRIEKEKTGDVSSVTVFEAGGTVATFKQYSVKEFESRVARDKIVAFRYKYIDSVLPYDFSDKVEVREDVTYLKKSNLQLCPNRGDRSVYRAGETIEIDVLDSSYDQLVFKSSASEYEFKVDKGVNRFDDLAPGHYKAYLKKGNSISDYVEFILTRPQVDVSFTDKIHIEFECDYGVPSYCIVCKENGSVKSIIDFTREDIEKGCIDLDPIEGGHWCYKVVFETPYGTVINNPVLV